MISSRVKRGAIRTHVLIRNRIDQYRVVPMKRSTRILRSAALSLVAVRLVLGPVPTTTPAQAAGLSPLPLDAEPPSTVPLDGSLLRPDLGQITFGAGLTTEAQYVVVASPATPSLNDIQAGKSIETEQQEEAAKKAEANRKAAEKARAAQAAKAAAQRVLAAATTVSTPSFTGNPQDMVYEMTAQIFGEEHWTAMHALIMRESGFNPNSFNKSSGACGLFQALPCSKMGGMELGNQVQWGINYIKNRYGNPTNAWNFWLNHHWY